MIKKENMHIFKKMILNKNVHILRQYDMEQ